ncbi:MAG: ABC transporter ATP-binding protein [Candidatus Limnocylindrales bacterium]
MSLVIDGLHKRFGDVVALDGIGFRVEPGEVFGFLGANGAGKTTTMRIVLGILEPDAGTVTWNDRPTAELPRRTWGYLPEERGLYSRMTVLDQLVYFAGLYGVDRRTARHEVHAWLERFRVPEFADRRAEQLSKGNQQKVQFIAAILHDPDVLIMDEPFTGLDPVNAALLKEAFIEMRDRGKTLIFSTHQMDLVEELAGSIAIVDRGRVVVGGRLADIKRASGRRMIRIAVAGDPDRSWLAGLPGSTVIRTGLDYAEVELDEGADPQAVLAAAREHGPVTRFELADPSVEAIFIEHVGRRPDEDERHLAAVPPPGSGAVTLATATTSGPGPAPSTPAKPAAVAGGKR